MRENFFLISEFPYIVIREARPRSKEGQCERMRECCSIVVKWVSQISSKVILINNMVVMGDWTTV